MKLDIHVHHHDATGPIMAGISVILRELQMISPEVKAILDRAKQNTSLVQSVDIGMKGLSKQVADLQAKIDSLPVGNVLSDEDKAALVEAAGDLDGAITTLQADIPANTQASGVGAQSGGSTSDPDNQSGALDPNGKQATGETPQPLPGTGPQS